MFAEGIFNKVSQGRRPGSSSTAHGQEDPGKRPRQTGGPDGNYGIFVYKHRQIKVFLLINMSSVSKTKKL